MTRRRTRTSKSSGTRAISVRPNPCVFPFPALRVPRSEILAQLILYSRSYSPSTLSSSSSECPSHQTFTKPAHPSPLAFLPSFPLGRDDPTPSRGSQLPRAASLILSSLGFIHDLRAGVLEPDKVRGVGLDMDQYTRVSSSLLALSRSVRGSLRRRFPSFGVSSSEHRGSLRRTAARWS
jgi:hypothetical protein